MNSNERDVTRYKAPTVETLTAENLAEVLGPARAGSDVLNGCQGPQCEDV